MKRSLFFLVLAVLWASPSSFACDSCGCSLARADREPFFFDFNFEQQVWHKREVGLAHPLHEEGHDAHDKTHEEFYHFTLGMRPLPDFTVLAEVPYTVRHSIEIEDEDHSGERQLSEGFGDLQLTGIYRLLKAGNHFLGPLAGVKFPIGKTTGRNKQGKKFEPELQPGSGSYDTLLGGAYRVQLKSVTLHGNVLCAIRTKGAQEFRFGNLFSTYLYADYRVNPQSQFFKTKIGLDMTLQHERKQTHRGVKVKDSGGTTYLLGPEFSVQGNDHLLLFGNILFPVYQNLGGVHQEVRFIWNAGVKIVF